MAGASRFFDAETGQSIQLQLQQSGACFKLLRQFGYRDPRYREPFVVPADPETFETDLASIPLFFAWLVPGLGSHLPAVLLHDGLVVNEGEPKSHIGPDVDREEADRILRDAMASLGTPRIRRWIMWTAVMLATAWSALRPPLRWRGLVVLTPATVVVLGSLATLDLLDLWDVLPWMGHRVWWAELLGGAVFALLIPLAISTLWGRLWPVGAITGVALAFLLHVTLAILTLYGIYWVTETAISRPEGTRANAHQSFLRAVAEAPTSGS
jgi:hypothetical protein